MIWMTTLAQLIWAAAIWEQGTLSPAQSPSGTRQRVPPWARAVRAGLCYQEQKGRPWAWVGTSVSLLWEWGVRLCRRELPWVWAEEEHPFQAAWEFRRGTEYL